jgi:hypothetical protein
MIIPRINKLARHQFRDGSSHYEVRAWANNVVCSGWMHQLFPAGATVNRTMASLTLRYDPRTGIPLGMRQGYFDKVQKEKKIIGWTRTPAGGFHLSL